MSVPCGAAARGERGGPARDAERVQQDRRGQHGRGVRRHRHAHAPPRRRQDDEPAQAAPPRAAVQRSGECKVLPTLMNTYFSILFALTLYSV